MIAHAIKDECQTNYHLVRLIPTSISNTRFSMLTSPKYFSTQRHMRGHTLHYEDPIKKNNNEHITIKMVKSFVSY
jgi:hypothetical protein